MAIGIPLISMGAAFLILYVLVPVRSTQPVLKAMASSAVHAPSATVAVAPAASPVRLQIPSLAIDTTINPVGLTSTGAMDIGEDPDQVAWYDGGPIPGQAGSAVIAGHYGWEKNGHGSIFNTLNTLHAGDIISVYDASGKETNFSVRESQLYSPSADASGVFNADDDNAHLNLITCQGTWVSAKASYSDRLVVFADLVK